MKAEAARPDKKNRSEITQACLTLCDPMDCSLTGSSIHGILQARVLDKIVNIILKLRFNGHMTLY